MRPSMDITGHTGFETGIVVVKDPVLQELLQTTEPRGK
jgi:hypothetical protein